jgi:hypothetical protein
MEFQSQIANKTNEELLQIYLHPADYQEQFVTLAEEELLRRNVSIEKHQQERKQKIEAATKAIVRDKKADDTLVLIGFILAVLGGLIGISIGIFLMQTKRDNVTGEQYNVYDKKGREAGRAMVIVGIAAIILFSIWKFRA